MASKLDLPHRRVRHALQGMAKGFCTLAVVVILGVTATLSAPPAAASPSHTLTPHSATAHVLKPRTRGAAPDVITGPLLNHGGLVQPAPRVYVVFWGWISDPSGEQAYLDSFLSSVSNTGWLSTVNQYGGGSAGHNLLVGTWSDGAAVPVSPSDAQIQQEASSAASHFGVGNAVNVEIVVATPTGHSTPGFGLSFCAYHGAVAANPNITYTDLPYMTDAGTLCGEDSVNGASGTLDGVSIVEGHELVETITDPLLDAWSDAGKNEIGDKCAWSGLANISTSSGIFAVQPLWSNVANGCVLSSPVSGLTITRAACGQGPPGSLAICQMQWINSGDPVVVQWLYLNRTLPGQTDTLNHSSIFRGICPLLTFLSISVKVTDSLGNSASWSGGTACR